MRRKHCILGTLALPCLLATGYYIGVIYNAHGRQVAEWNEGAKAAFEEALWVEVNKRSEIPMYSYSSGERGMTTLSEKIPDTIFVTSELGRRGYHIERYKYEHSLIKETGKRVSLSTLLIEYPLLVDSLNMHWNSLLSVNQIPIKSQVRYIYTDLDLLNDTVYSTKIQTEATDSLIVKYLGFRCEHELVGYVSHPSWLSGLSRSNWYWLIVLWGVFVLFIVSYSSLEGLFRRKFVEERIVEKEIHVADVHINKADIFKLPDGTIFNSFARILSRNGIQHTIQPQSVSLLKLFLSKGDLKVTSEEISWELWQEKREKDRLYSAIRRLRNDLKAVKSDHMISCTDGVYELKSPISSHISGQN